MDEAAKAADGVDVSNFGKWQGRALAEQRSESILSFHRTQCMRMAWDGLRYGNPAKVYCLTHVSELARQRHAVLPLAERLGQWAAQFFSVSSIHHISLRNPSTSAIPHKIC